MKPADAAVKGGGKTWRAVVATATVLLLAACAAISDPPASSGAVSPVLETGRTIAVYRCAACHGVYRNASSRNPGAPRFSDLARRYPAADLESRLGRIAREGHGAMPAYAFAPNEAPAIAAYIATLRGRS